MKQKYWIEVRASYVKDVSPRLQMFLDIFAMLPEPYKEYIDRQVEKLLDYSSQDRLVKYEQRLGFASALEVVIYFNLIKDGALKVNKFGIIEPLVCEEEECLEI